MCRLGILYDYICDQILWYVMMVNQYVNGMSMEYALIPFLFWKMLVESGRSKHFFERQWFDSYLEMDINLLSVESWHHSSSNLQVIYSKILGHGQTFFLSTCHTSLARVQIIGASKRFLWRLSSTHDLWAILTQLDAPILNRRSANWGGPSLPFLETGIIWNLKIHGIGKKSTDPERLSPRSLERLSRCPCFRDGQIAGWGWPNLQFLCEPPKFGEQFRYTVWGSFFVVWKDEM